MAKKKLTVKSIDEIMPGAKDIILWDSDIPGFGLKVTPKGHRSFLLFYRAADHTQRKPSLGQYPTLKPEAARKIALNMLAEARAGGDPSAVRKASRAQRGQNTVSELVEAFLIAKSKLKSIDEIERIFRKDILPMIGSLNVEKVKRSDVTRLLEKIEARAPVLGRNARAHLSSFYSWAMPRLSDTAVNPVVGAMRIPAPAARDRILDHDEIKALWAALETEPVKWRLAIRILILTGQRRAEVLEADWREFNMVKLEWIIPAERAKNKRAHTVPLTPAIIALLETIPHRYGRVFTGVSQISRAAKRIRRKMQENSTAPIEAWVWHDIRRTVATGLQRLGVRTDIIEATLNHVSGSRSGIVGVYQRYDWAAERREALEQWGKEVEQIVS